MFKNYTSKPTTVSALEIKPDQALVDQGDGVFDYGSDGDVVTFNAHQTPEVGDFIIMQSVTDIYLCPADVFAQKYASECSKTLHNSTVDGARKNVSDLVVYGDGDTFKLICKASSKDEGWMKSTKAMEIEGVGCVVQVTTQQGDNVSEALTFAPCVKIEEIDGDKVNGRKLVNMFPPKESQING